MSNAEKRKLFETFATVARGLGNGHRLELLEILAQRERSVDELAHHSGLPFGNVSQHLQHLRRAGLVDARKEGKRVYYRLADDEVVALVGTLHRLAERNLAEVEQIVAGYFRERDRLEHVTRQDLIERMQCGMVTILDVRPAEEFAAGHLPGAVNISVRELAARLGEIPADQEIVAYCRGPYCIMSFEAVSLLRSQGFEARRMEDGFPEWRAAGFPVSGTS